MASLSTCHLGLWLGWQILLNLVTVVPRRHQEYLGKRLLEHFAMSEQRLAVVFGTTTYTNKDNSVNKNRSTHSREEADTQIPLQVIDVTTQGRSIQYIYVWSPDTDVFLVLMDLVVTCTIHVPGRLKLLTGRGTFYRTIDIKERCAAIGVEQSKALIGIHNFTDADWSGKIFNISKKT